MLIGSSFQHPWGSSIYAKIVAYNTYGYSSESADGNGAIILTYPDAPISVAETVASRTPTTISITWSLGSSNGGASVEDYRITYDQSSDDFVVLVSGLNQLSYTASALTTGNTYKFKLEARNSLGYSSYSSVVSILCADMPS
jgi:hypothetical protein